MADFKDIRAMVLNNEVKANQQAIYIGRLGGWFTVRELMGDEKGEVLNNSINQRTSRVDIKVLYAELFVRSLRYPDPTTPPPPPVPPAPLGPDPTEKEQTRYDKALLRYYNEVEGSKYPYPMDHPRAGELVFQPLDRDAMNQALPSEILERIAEIVMPMNGLNPGDLEEKKAISNGTIIDSSASSLQSS